MKKITLRAVEPEDINLILQWDNEPDQWTETSTHTPISRHAIEQYVLDNVYSDIYGLRQQRLMAVDADTQATIGCIDLLHFNPHDHHAEIGMLIAPAYRGQGYGRPVVEALLLFARNNLQLHQVYCEIAVSNQPCLAIYDALGFVRQGVRTDWIRTPDGWVDAVLFAKILD